MEKKKISMVDIARMADVSVATVSRILNRNGRYSPETEKRVMSFVEEYGYHINQNAKGLRTNKTLSIGVIVPDITNEFFAKIIRAIEMHIADRGYTVFVCDSNEDEQMENFHISSLIAKDVDGIIYISGKSDVKKIYENYKIPVVYIDRRPKNAGTLVISDNAYGGYLATECLLQKGCKRILMLRDHRNLSPVRHRFSGYVSALRKYGVALETDLIADTVVDYTASKNKIKELLDNGLVFDGVFASSDIIALGALHALHDRGVKIPETVKIVGFDGITMTEICNPSMTTVRQDTDEFGRSSVDALLKLIESGGNAAYEKFTIPVELIQRQTTG